MASRTPNADRVRCKTPLYHPRARGRQVSCGAFFPFIADNTLDFLAAWQVISALLACVLARNNESIEAGVGSLKTLTGGVNVALARKLENQQNGYMKMTLDLPDALIKQVKLRALRRGRKLKEAVAELLRMGLAAANHAAPPATAAVVGTDKQTGLPLIHCKHPAAPGEEITPERVAEILLAQDEEWHHAASR